MEFDKGLPVRDDGLTFEEVKDWLDAQPAAAGHLQTPMLFWIICSSLQLTWLDLSEITLVESEHAGDYEGAFYVPIQGFPSLRLRSSLVLNEINDRIMEKSALYGVELDT